MRPSAHEQASFREMSGGLFWVYFELTRPSRISISTRPLRKEQNAFRMAISAVFGDSGGGVFGLIDGLITALGRLKWANFH